MNFKKTFFMIFVFCFNTIVLSKSKNQNKLNNQVKKNNYNIEFIKNVFSEYFTNLDSIIENEKKILKNFIIDEEINILSNDDLIILIIYRSLIPSMNTMYAEIIKNIQFKNNPSEVNSNLNSQDKNLAMIFKKIENLLYDYAFESYIETIKLYIQSKKNKNTDYYILMENVVNQIQLFMKIFLNKVE